MPHHLYKYLLVLSLSLWLVVLIFSGNVPSENIKPINKDSIIARDSILIDSLETEIYGLQNYRVLIDSN